MVTKRQKMRAEDKSTDLNGGTISYTPTVSQNPTILPHILLHVNTFSRRQFPCINTSSAQMFADKQNKSKVLLHKFPFPFRRDMQNLKRKE